MGGEGMELPNSDDEEEEAESKDPLVSATEDAAAA